MLKTLKAKRHIFSNVLSITVVLGIIFVAYVYGMSKGYSNGYATGMGQGKEQGKIEILQQQQKAAEQAIKDAQARIQQQQKDSQSAPVSNTLEDTVTNPFGAPITNPFK